MSALVLHHKKGIEDVLKVVKETREKNKGNAGMVEVASYNSVSHRCCIFVGSELTESTTVYATCLVRLKSWCLAGLRTIAR